MRHADDINNQELETLIGKDKIIKKAFFEVERFNWTDKEILLYQQEGKKPKDDKAVLKYAEEQGKKEGIREGNAKFSEKA